MAIALYDLSVASYLQTLGGVAGFLERGKAHLVDNGIDPQEVVDTRLFPDMLPFAFQVLSISHHSSGAIEGLRRGRFAPPPRDLPPHTYDDLQQIVAQTRATLEAVSPEEVNAFEGRDMEFALGDFKIPFTAETFLLSFSLPNFYFHVTTAYDILRAKGVPIGKRDYMGKMRTRG